MRKLKEERLGEISISNEGYKMKIVEYNGKNDIIVEFQDKYKARVHKRYDHFLEGVVKNPYHPSIYGVGYIGVGKYKVSENGKKTDAYKTWSSMLQRCYDAYYINKELTYVDCYVCEDWHNFQNFGKWWEENVYNCNNERMHLDKDILIKGNKIYSPNTCIIVPERINKLFIRKERKKDKNLPIGVFYYNNNGLMAKISKTRKNKEIVGVFPLDKPFQAFTCYKENKENYIKQVADEYKDLIPTKLYEALYNYEIDIND